MFKSGFYSRVVRGLGSPAGWIGLGWVGLGCEIQDFWWVGLGLMTRGLGWVQLAVVQVRRKARKHLVFLDEMGS